MEKKIIKTRIVFVLCAMFFMMLLQAFIILFSYQRSYYHMTENADALLTAMLDSKEPIEDGNRYLIVEIDENHTVSNVKFINTGKNVKEKISDYVKVAMKNQKDTGYVDSYRYMKRKNPVNRSVTIAYLLRSGNIAMLRSNMESIIVASLVSCFIICIVLILASRLIVRPIKEANDMQKEFISYASHALKTPITIIQSSADLLEEELDNNEWVSIIKEQSKSMSDMTNSLVMISKMENQRVADNTIEFPLSDVLREILKSFEPIAVKNNIVVTQNIENDVEYCGNENDIRQLITLLLDNAHKYAGKNGEISVELTRGKDGVHIKVINTSVSYSNDQLRKMFDRFYRGSEAKERGFGIGLYVASLIVKRHKGKINARMQDDKYICFNVFLGCV